MLLAIRSLFAVLALVALVPANAAVQTTGSQKDQQTPVIQPATSQPVLKPRSVLYVEVETGVWFNACFGLSQNEARAALEQPAIDVFNGFIPPDGTKEAPPTGSPEGLVVALNKHFQNKKKPLRAVLRQPLSFREADQLVRQGAAVAYWVKTPWWASNDDIRWADGKALRVATGKREGVPFNRDYICYYLDTNRGYDVLAGTFKVTNQSELALSMKLTKRRDPMFLAIVVAPVAQSITDLTAPDKKEDNSTPPPADKEK